MRGSLAPIALVLVLACSQKLVPVDTATPPSDSDTDTDADADSDADSDADADTGLQLDCANEYSTPPPSGGTGGGYPACVTERVFCGDVILATTAGGSNVYDYAYWQANSNLGQLTNSQNQHMVDGPERVFVFDPLFAGESVTFEVESCNRVWASYVATGAQTQVCDTTSNSAPKGHFTPRQDRYLQDTFVNGPSMNAYAVQVNIDSDPASPQPNNFILRVTCD